MSSQSNFEPIRVTLSKEQIVELLVDRVAQLPAPDSAHDLGRSVIRRAVEALDELGLLAREAK